MATPPMDPAKITEARELVERFGTVAEASRASGIPYSTLEKRYKRNIDPAIQDGMNAIGTGMVPQLLWAKTKREDGTSFSVLLKPEVEPEHFLAQIREAVSDTTPVNLPPRFPEEPGSLLVLDPADVHIGKLCVAAETGFAYDTEIAAHRLTEGSRVLLAQAKALGVSRILLVIGNDIAHIDTPRRTTTSGTPQDTDGTIFTIYRAASKGYRGIVQIALEMGLSVELLFCPSNHDWVLGYTIAQELRAWFHAHPNFRASDYNLSERHIKYYRFGCNLMMFTHGDGAKEADLPHIMLVEARHHIAECPHRYAYVHHYHHKIRKALGVRPMVREKDHIAMTVTQAGAGAMEGDNLQIEYVRSPSPPDGWHHRNGYINRQAVEAFIHHPEDGRKVSLTEWF